MLRYVMFCFGASFGLKVWFGQVEDEPSSWIVPQDEWTYENQESQVVELDYQFWRLEQ